MIKVVAFDIGGTLMEYKDMPYCWLDYYENALDRAVKSLGLSVSEEQRCRTLEILRSFNPKVNPREKDYTPEHIFGAACADWEFEYDLGRVIGEFFAAFDLKAYIYPDTLPVLEELRVAGYKLAALTDIATAMPDELHRSYFPELLPYLDMYVSSVSCGWRKPAPKGLYDIADNFGVSPDEMIYVGDERKDIGCAHRFGCTGILIDRRNTGAEYGQDHTISDLTALKQIIK
ncbi:MAG: HAD family hydrolase [Oscillospiraceae bacterium]|nr:HAD family hydrolase [Oscillospiraceae bacterium]